MLVKLSADRIDDALMASNSAVGVDAPAKKEKKDKISWLNLSKSSKSSSRGLSVLTRSVSVSKEKSTTKPRLFNDPHGSAENKGKEREKVVVGDVLDEWPLYRQVSRSFRCCG